MRYFSEPLLFYLTVFLLAYHVPILYSTQGSRMTVRDTVPDCMDLAAYATWTVTLQEGDRVCRTFQPYLNTQYFSAEHLTGQYLKNAC